MGSSTDWKLTGSQRLTYRSESSEPHIKPSHVGDPAQGERAPEHLALKASGACVQELHGTGGNRDPILKRHTQTFTCTESQGKAKSPRESGSNLTAVLGGHPGKTGVNVACCEGRTLKAKALGNIQQQCLSLEVAILGKSGHTHQPAVEKPQGEQQPRWDHSPTLQ